MKITLVKKIKADGSPCRKCADVTARLEQGGYMSRIDHVVIADERDPESPGMKIAARHAVDLAPFFVVEENGKETIYTAYTKFLKEILQSRVPEGEEIAELMERNPDLDFL